MFGTRVHSIEMVHLKVKQHIHIPYIFINLKGIDWKCFENALEILSKMVSLKTISLCYFSIKIRVLLP